MTGNIVNVPATLSMLNTIGIEHPIPPSIIAFFKRTVNRHLVSRQGSRHHPCHCKGFIVSTALGSTFHLTSDTLNSFVRDVYKIF